MYLKTKSSSEIVQYLLGHSSSPYKWEIVWQNVILFLILHAGALYGGYLYIFKSNVATMLFFWFYAVHGGTGVTAGVHRLWSHKSYKARLPLRILLIILNSVAFQNHAYEWCRDHRLHHKFSETDADPHNSKRGFFFSHMGWLLVRKHPEVIKKGKTIDMSDLEQDPVIRFQRKYHNIMGFIFSALLPFSVTAFGFGESYTIAFFVSVNLRYIYSLHATWTVNSVAHMFGNRPYDKNIGPVQNGFVSFFTFGEGWHNYHHVFPWDYKAAELPFIATDLTTIYINFFSKLGLAYDLKTVPKEVIQKRLNRTGDKSAYMNETCNKKLGDDRQLIRENSIVVRDDEKKLCNKISKFEALDQNLMDQSKSVRMVKRYIKADDQIKPMMNSQDSCIKTNIINETQNNINSMSDENLNIHTIHSSMQYNNRNGDRVDIKNTILNQIIDNELNGFDINEKTAINIKIPVKKIEEFSFTLKMEKRI